MTSNHDDQEQKDPFSADILDSELEALVRDSLDRFLALMKPEYSEVFRRAELLGESHEMIAVSLGISSGTVEARLHAARAAIRRLLVHGARSHLDQP